jgi:hypothetical protein
MKPSRGTAREAERSQPGGARLLAEYPVDFERAAGRIDERVPSLDASARPALRELAAEQMRDWLQTLMEIRQEAFAEIPAHVKSDPDARLNTTQWTYLFAPHQWADYDKPEYIWQPIGNIHKYNIVPLIIGTLKTTIISLLFAVLAGRGDPVSTGQPAPEGNHQALHRVVIRHPFGGDGDLRCS